MNALSLAEGRPGAHSLEAYEWEPQTRQILRDVLKDSGADQRVNIHIVSPADAEAVFDGEAYIADQICRWGKENLILLDPFAMWRQPEHQRNRDLYGAMIDGLRSKHATTTTSVTDTAMAS